MRGAGRAAAGPAALVPSECDFGSVEVGTRATCPVLIQSTGDQELTVQTLNLVDGNTDIFGAVAREDDTSLLPIADLTLLPANVPPGTALELRVAVVPTSAGAATATLRLGTNVSVR